MASVNLLSCVVRMERLPASGYQLVRGATLDGAIFSGAIFRGYFGRSDLRWGNLQRSHLAWRHLARRHLVGAFVGAILLGAILLGAILLGAILLGAILLGAICGAILLGAAFRLPGVVEMLADVLLARTAFFVALKLLMRDFFCTMMISPLIELSAMSWQAGTGGCYVQTTGRKLGIRRMRDV